MRVPLLSLTAIRRSSTSAAPLASNGRFLTTQKSRLGRLFFHGTNESEVKEASQILQDLSTNWRTYVAGSEGYLVDPRRRGLYRHNVSWGDMVPTLRAASSSSPDVTTS